MSEGESEARWGCVVAGPEGEISESGDGEMVVTAVNLLLSILEGAQCFLELQTRGRKGRIMKQCIQYGNAAP